MSVDWCIINRLLIPQSVFYLDNIADAVVRESVCDEYVHIPQAPPSPSPPPPLPDPTPLFLPPPLHCSLLLSGIL